MTYDDRDFEVRLGRIRDVGAQGPRRRKLFTIEVLQAAIRAGHRGRRFDGRRALAGSRFGRGRGAALAAGLRSPARRVVVQARVVRHFGRSFRSAPLAVHLVYLKREGVDRAGGAGRLFDATGEADGSAFAARCEPDRHHFRFMVSPEDAGQLADLRQTTRELMAQAEKDLGTRLDWAAVDHWNTAHPHVHVLVRGRADTGEDLVISRDYISRGLRARAEALVSLELGPRSAREIAADLQRQVAAERWTKLDRLLVALAEKGRVDLRPGAGAPDPDLRPLLLGRAASLQRLGFAVGEAVGVWRLAEDLESRLRELGLRGDIVMNLQRAIGERRAWSDLAPMGEDARSPVIGRVVERGLFDEQSGQAYLVLDGLDGRAHHVRLPDLGAVGDTPVGGLAELRPAAEGRPPQLVHRSDLPIEAQIEAEGATWLDRQLVAAGPSARSDHGFGAEVEAALHERREHLQRLGLAERRAGGWSYAKGLLAELRRREIEAVARRLESETLLRFRDDEDGRVRGLYSRRVDLASGRFAMIEDGLGFRLVPWARVLDRRLGEEVSGIARDRGIEWDAARKRGIAR
jgi:type IV secretory pathway VirD2 relaxase